MDQSIALSELADAVSLSEDTLNTYVNCGILRGENRGGEIFLSLSEIQTIFGEIAVSRIAIKPRPKAPTSTENDISGGEAPTTPSEIVDPAPEPETPNQTLTIPTEAPPQISTELLSIAGNLRDQIEQLRQERDWLRSRIEHLESRSDRDQMLILSQSENVRKLISPTPRKSWLNLLPWYKGD
jgi:hypothetical protein